MGALVSWEPFDFGLRRANVKAARAERDVRAAEVNVTKLQVSTAAADAFLTLVAAQQTVIAAQAGVERSRVLNQVLETLVKNELRPGADASRTRAELALAQTHEIQAEQARDVARAALTQLTGGDLKTLTVESAKLLNLPGRGRTACRRDCATSTRDSQKCRSRPNQGAGNGFEPILFPEIQSAGCELRSRKRHRRRRPHRGYRKRSRTEYSELGYRRDSHIPGFRLVLNSRPERHGSTQRAECYGAL